MRRGMCRQRQPVDTRLEVEIGDQEGRPREDLPASARQVHLVEHLMLALKVDEQDGGGVDEIGHPQLAV